MAQESRLKPLLQKDGSVGGAFAPNLRPRDSKVTARGHNEFRPTKGDRSRLLRKPIWAGEASAPPSRFDPTIGRFL
jgi:hypothetical protein